ncbi:hypothetical protein CR513_49029, partial [Mucuna pruriens]
MKSHDYLVFMQQLLSIAFDSLPKCNNFFRELTSTILNVEKLRVIKDNIPMLLCKWEQIFSPSFFNSMEHLPFHLPYEAIVGGLVQYCWLCLFERYKTSNHLYTIALYLSMGSQIHLRDKDDFNESAQDLGHIPTDSESSGMAYHEHETGVNLVSDRGELHACHLKCIGLSLVKTDYMPTIWSVVVRDIIYNMLGVGPRDLRGHGFAYVTSSSRPLENPMAHEL